MSTRETVEVTVAMGLKCTKYQAITTFLNS